VQSSGSLKITRRTPSVKCAIPLRSWRRWKVERLIAWLQNFRRVLVQDEVKLENYRAFVYLVSYG